MSFFAQRPYVSVGAGVVFLLAVLAILQPHRNAAFSSEPRHLESQWSFPGQWTFDVHRDGGNYGLTDSQCDRAFPGLFDEITAVVRRRHGRPITEESLSRSEQWPNGSMRAMIYDGQLYIINATNPGVRKNRQFSTFHALNRAIVANSNDAKLPNIEFMVSVEDKNFSPEWPVWAYDKRKSDRETWLMPDFGFYAWPEPGVGTYGQVRKKMEDVEAEIPSFRDKIPKLIWRGAIAPGVAPALRQAFVDAAGNESWSDVKKLAWHKEDGPRNLIPIEDHCKYMFIAHTEGRAWSGRLKFVQNCKSVIVAHKLRWYQHHQHLMIPHGPEQNFVQVSRDFSDLHEKMEYLTTHLDVAEGIAQRSATLFRDRYITPAAEACYWRRLVREWAKISFRPRFYQSHENGTRTWRGVPFESFALMRQLEWRPGSTVRCEVE